jgi:hypothetical protein
MIAFATGPGSWGRAAIFACWFIGVSIPLAPLAVQHLAPLGRIQPAPAGRAPEATVRHVLATDCRCSRAVAEHLVARGARTGEVEEVWLVGSDDPLADALRKSGYRVRPATASEVRAALGPAGAPFLFVYGVGSREIYAGGYAARRPREPRDVRDLAILDAVRSGRPMEPWPAYGCLGAADASAPNGL